MELLFSNLTTVVTDGIAPNMMLLVDWLTDPDKGLFIGLIVIVCPLLRRIISIFVRLFK